MNLAEKKLLLAIAKGVCGLLAYRIEAMRKNESDWQNESPDNKMNPFSLAIPILEGEVSNIVSLIARVKDIDKS